MPCHVMSCHVMSCVPRPVRGTGYGSNGRERQNSRAAACNLNDSVRWFSLGDQQVPRSSCFCGKMPQMSDVSPGHCMVGSRSTRVQRAPRVDQHEVNSFATDGGCHGAGCEWPWELLPLLCYHCWSAAAPVALPAGRPRHRAPAGCWMQCCARFRAAAGSTRAP